MRLWVRSYSQGQGALLAGPGRPRSRKNKVLNKGKIWRSLQLPQNGAEFFMIPLLVENYFFCLAIKLKP